MHMTRFEDEDFDSYMIFVRSGIPMIKTLAGTISNYSDEYEIWHTHTFLGLPLQVVVVVVVVVVPVSDKKRSSVQCGCMIERLFDCRQCRHSL